MQKVIDMAKDRGAYICQSQSMNLWMAEPTFKNLTAMHMYSWKSGLKTGQYYLRTKPKAKAQQFTVEPVGQTTNQPDCEMCSS
jgi:ribonucleotide reductase alpha subunit